MIVKAEAQEKIVLERLTLYELNPAVCDPRIIKSIPEDWRKMRCPVKDRKQARANVMNRIEAHPELWKACEGVFIEPCKFLDGVRRRSRLRQKKALAAQLKG